MKLKSPLWALAPLSLVFVVSTTVGIYLVSLLFAWSLIMHWRWWFGVEPAIVLQPPVDLPIVILIAAYNEEALIEETIRSAQHQTRPIDKIIVIDDCSQDSTGDIARALGAIVVRTPKNQGSKASALNYALGLPGLVDTPLFVTMDADTTIKEDAIEKTLRYFNDPEVAVVSGHVVPKRIKSIWERGRLIEYLYALGVMKPAQHHHQKILVVSGCFAVFRTDVMRELGGFNERTKTEDMDYAWGLQGTRYHACYTQEAECYPTDPSTFNIYYKQVFRWQSGFLQNIRVRSFKWFWRNKSFGLMVYSYLFMNILGLLLSFFSWSLMWQNVGRGLLTLFAIQVLMVWLPALWTARRKGLLLKAVTCIPAFMVIQFVNLGIFAHVIWNEWVRGKTLSTWARGH